MARVQEFLRRHHGDMDFRPAWESGARLANRRRLVVFTGVFVVLCVLSLAYTFLRAPQYRALTLLQITPGAAAPRPIETVSVQSAAPGAESDKPFLTEVQVLGSRPVLEQTVARLARDGHDLAALGEDPVAAMQAMIQVSPVSGTAVVEMSATGAQAGLLAPLLNTAVDAYREHLAATARESIAGVLAGSDEEILTLERRVAEKNDEVEAFRIAHDIVSLEREENQVLARVRGVAASLNTANERVAVAEGRLRSVSEAMAAGSAVTRSRDDPTLANLEQRASQIREDLGELERNYTSDYMSLDPNIKAKRDRLAELERQIAVQRGLNAQAALAEAREELASAREMAARIRQQEASDRDVVQEFSARFNEYKALQDELTELQTLYRAATQRKVRLEASERERMPSVQVLEAATTPQTAWRPLYARDAGIAVAGSFVLALLAMWFVELFNRPEPQPSVLITQPGGPLLGAAAPVAALAGAANRMLEVPERALLPAGPVLPAELAPGEVAELLHAATAEGRLGMLLILSGASPEEALALSWDDVDLERQVVAIRGDSARQLPLSAPLRAALGAREACSGAPLLADAQGRALAMDGLHAAILCAAHDAGIGHAGVVTPAALRHTFIAFLVRQGVRFADLAQLVGRLPAETLAAYSSLSPAGPRVPLEQVERVMPALQV
ncbi:MAG: tyrosine-type recombinase/integrase [Gammaproteobacteria bacterium]|nr:tyrosine-type recombinase/integrase [Gammaproteobacteria bacterium]MBP6481453.1 tyrosine-type recombinase/integrase [Pseudomonadales bacterium]MBP7909475.1 tyrosine-type recombinase/integrase [Pseudomonadales bacterium]